MAVYGIDLGATESRIAYVDDTGQPVVLKNALGEEATLSVVYFESPENVVVGREAKSLARLFPNLVVEMVMRQMGKDVHYSFHGQDHTPESVSALIVRELARAAQRETGEEVRDVVITVPAYFGLLEREATHKAGQIAGLNVLDILDEPVAATLNYETLGEEVGTRNILAYHLGRTFDTTIIRVDRDDVHVICTDGDRHLGGADWDRAIRDFLVHGFTEEYPQLEAASDEEFMEELVYSAERLKVALSGTMTYRHTMRLDGGCVRLELTREHFEELTSELLDRSMEITARTLATARSTGVEWLNDVFLVGGMTHMPVIAQMLRERFGFESRLLPDRHLAVVKGAALFALMKKVNISMADDSDSGRAEQIGDQFGISVRQVENLAAKRVVTVVPRAFGIKVNESADRAYISHLITANTPLPADTEPLTFLTVSDDQREIQMEVWEQTSSVCSEELEHNRHVCDVVFTDLPPLPAQTRLEVFFHMTETGLLRVHGRELASGREFRGEIQAVGLDKTETRHAAAESSTASQRVSPTRPAIVAAEAELIGPVKATPPAGTEFLRERIGQPHHTQITPAQRTQGKRKVFISYVREDSTAIDLIASELQAQGIDVWLDRTHLSVGDRWKDVIRNAIRDGDYFLACFSPAYARRSETYMNEELLVAIEELRLRPRVRRWFLPIRLGECTIPAYPIGPAETLKDIHHIDLGRDWKSGVENLIRVLTRDGDTLK